MTTSPVIGRAVWKARALGADPALLTTFQADLQMIPGVKAHDLHSITTPWSALETVVRAAAAARVDLDWFHQPAVHVPRPWGPEHAEELLDALYHAGIKPGALFGGDVLPGGGLLAAFQMEAIWFALERGSGLLKESPGAGKTIQALALALAKSRERGLPALVVTPSSVVRQYVRQVERLTTTTATELRAPSLAPVQNGRRLTTTEILDRSAAAGRRVVVVGWDSLGLHLDALLARPWAAVVFDEAQLGKTGKRQVWKRLEDGRLEARWTQHRAAAAARLAQHVPHRFATTATPIFDRRPDLWGVATLVDPWGWGATPKRFLIRYCGGHQGEYGFVATERINDAELATRLGSIFHVVPKTVSHAQLPPTRVVCRFIAQSDLDPEPKGFGRRVVDLGRAAKQGSLEAGAQLRETLLMATAARKRSAVVEDVRAFLGADGVGKGKVLLFTGRHEDCWSMAKACEKALPGTDILSGVVQTPEGYALPGDSARDALHQQYMAHPGPCVFVATGGAWGTGLDLQDTDLLGVVMLPPNPGPFVQWLGRVERLGQTRSCEIRIYIGEGTSDAQMAYTFGDKAEDLVGLFGDHELDGIALKLKGVSDMGEALDRILQECRRAWGGVEDPEWGDEVAPTSPPV